MKHIPRKFQKKPLCVGNLGNYPFSTSAKFSEKLKFLTPSYAGIRVRIRGYEILAFGKIMRTY